MRIVSARLVKRDFDRMIKQKNLIKFVQDFKTIMEFSNSDSNIDKFKMFRSSHSVFCKKDVLKSFAKSRENSCARASFLIKLQPEAVFREIFKKTFFL